MKARPVLVVRPLFVSQETAFALLGITPRKFRELVVPMCLGSVVRVGKSALIPADVAEGALRALAVGPASEDEKDDPEAKRHRADEDEELQTADDILRAIGRRRAR